MPEPPALYDELGTTYRRTRSEDPVIAGHVHAALGDGQPVVNVGAGTGSYEPRDRQVIAVEPSAVMIASRPRGAAPVVQATAEALPFADRSFAAGMAVWTVHHWTRPTKGLRELRRVATRVVVVTADAATMNALWLTAEYFPAMAAGRIRPEIQPEAVAAVLGGTIRIEPLRIPGDCRDGFGEAFLGRPEAYLDPGVRANMSAFRLLAPDDLSAGLHRLQRDLASGAWDARHGDLRDLAAFDTGHRIVVSDLAG
jgi:SAM-dependent methyltransferase